MTRHLRLSLFLVALIAMVLFGALLMHLFRVGYATAADLETGVDAGITAPSSPAAPAPGPSVTSDSTPEEIADAAWWAMRAGYLGPTLLFAVFLGGMYARNRRGWIIRRWPQLDDGRAWAVVAIATMAAGTLIPLAAANALTRDAMWAAVVGAVGLYLMPTGKKPEPKSPGFTSSIDGSVS